MISRPKYATLWEHMKNWMTLPRQLVLYGIIAVGAGYLSYTLLTYTHDYSLRTYAYGTIIALNADTLEVRIKNTDTYFPSQPAITNRALSYDQDTIVTGQYFLEDNDVFIDATPPHNVPITELSVGKTVYVFYDEATSYAHRIYIGEPTLPF